MRLKIHGGTVRHGDPALCLTCRHATVVQGPSLQERVVDGGLLSSRDSRIPFPFRCALAAATPTGDYRLRWRRRRHILFQPKPWVGPGLC